MKIKPILFGLAGMFIILWACQPEKSDATVEVKEAGVDPFAAIKMLYQQDCASCHGVEVGAFADRKWKYGSSRDSILYHIAHGIPKDEMPAYDTVYTDEELGLMADFIIEAKENVEKYQFEGFTSESGTFPSEKFDIRTDTVVSGIKSPWGIGFLPDGDMLVTDKSGELYRVTSDGEKQEIRGVPDLLFKGQGGLLDVLVHPDFEENGWIYLSYSIAKEEGGETLSTTAVTRARLDGKQLDDVEQIFEAFPYFPTGHHYGCRMVFGGDGKLYISVGDRGKGEENSQALDRYLGKIHRINEDGSIPRDNPFLDRDDAVASIYSYGHRNPQGMDVHPETGEIWTHEHGPRGGDEINIIRKGKNYGWPIITHGINYDGTVLTELTEKEGMEDPLHYWVPSIAPCGMAFVTGDKYPGWEGNLMVGSLKYQYLDRVVLDGEKVVEEEPLLQKIGRVRSVAMGPDGYIYVGVEGAGIVVKLMPVL